MMFIRLIRCPAFCLMAMLPSALVGETGLEPSARLDLPVHEVRQTYAPYDSFCARHPKACDLSGEALVEFTPDVLHLLEAINTEVNRATDCRTSDKDLFDLEEHWAFPSGGAGDCEDIALFKRERLVELGLPRGALTIAIVHHRRSMLSHAILLAETSAGTYLLNTFTDDVVMWHEAPYNFEARERPDGAWDRFDQTIWQHD